MAIGFIYWQAGKEKHIICSVKHGKNANVTQRGGACSKAALTV